MKSLRAAGDLGTSRAKSPLDAPKHTLSQDGTSSSVSLLGEAMTSRGDEMDE
jgi:hypothetical protein